MLRYVPVDQLTPELYALLCESAKKGGMAPLEVSENLLSGRWKVFAMPYGVLAVSKAGTVLTVEALNTRRFGWFMRQFRDVMDRLATDWECNTVETFCFDERLMRAMMAIRGVPKAWLVEWQVEGTGDGR